MAKAAKPDSDENVISPQQQAASFLKSNKDDHYNFEDSIDYTVRSSSLSLTAAMAGGCHPSANRAIGVSAGGKTSCTLDFMFNFLKMNGGKGVRGIYVKSEGRLSPQVMARSGISFTNDAEQWRDGMCFVLESNVFEAVFGFIGELIRNNPTKTKYFIMIDSMDMMAKKDDLAKALTEAGQVAGGALITSVFLKKTSTAISKRGHIMWFLSQVREAIKINQYEKTVARQGSSSGGHAIEHAGDDVLDFLSRNQDDIILEDPKNKSSKPIGHYCKIKIIKSNNENYNTIVRYPVKYGRTGGTSVWIEREVADLLLSYELIEKAHAWLKIHPKLIEEVKTATGEELPEKIQGMDTLYEILENSKKITDFLSDKFLKMILSGNA